MWWMKKSWCVGRDEKIREEERREEEKRREGGTVEKRGKMATDMLSLV